MVTGQVMSKLQNINSDSMNDLCPMSPYLWRDFDTVTVMLKQDTLL